MERKQWLPVVAAGILSLAVAAPAVRAATEVEPGGAYGQGSMQYGTEHGAKASTAMKREHLGLVGTPVLDRDGRKIGRVSNVIIGPSGRAQSVVLTIGGTLGIGGTEYRVPWNRVSLGERGDGIMLGVAKNRVQSEFSAFEIKSERKTKRAGEMEEEQRGSR